MKQEKQLLLDEVKSHIQNFESFLIAKNNGLTAEGANALRTKIASAGGDVEMVRKRILIKVLEEAGLKLETSDLPGQIGLILSGPDYITVTKEVYKHIKENSGVIDVVGARFDGQYYESQDVEKLSKLPSADEMRSQMLGLFEAPMAQMLAVADALLTSVPNCLRQKAEESEG